MYPEISIIVPVYNAEMSLDACIKSILAQKYQHWKLLLIDDGSTDRSADICKCYTALDPRILYYYKQNGGVSSARNYGMDHLDTPYFVCVDSDDTVSTDYLSELWNTKLKFPEASHIWCSMQTVTAFSNDDTVLHLANPSEQYTLSDRKHAMTFYQRWLLQMPWNKLYNTSIVQVNHIRMDESLSLSEDLVFNLEYLDLCKNTQIVVINQALYNYFCTETQSLTHKYRPDLIDTYKISNNALLRCLSKWHADEDQLQIFYDVQYHKLERILENTFHPDNEESFFEKIHLNDTFLRTQYFQEALLMRKCYVNPAVLWAYRKKTYLIAYMVTRLSKLKQKLLHMDKNHE